METTNARKTRRDLRRLVRSVEATARRLRKPAEAANALQDVERHQLALDGDLQWESWRQLIRIDRRSKHQVKYLERAKRDLQTAARSGLAPAKQPSLLKPFGLLAGGKGAEDSNLSLDQLSDLVESTCEQWKAVRGRLTSRVPRVLVVHAFLVLSHASGVEIASLVVGGLVVFGLIHSYAYYQGAIGTSVLPYFTLDDLLSQGVRGLAFLVAVFFVMEVLFLALRKSDRVWSSSPRFRPLWWFLRHPAWMVVTVAVLTASLTALVGADQGRAKRENFFDLQQEYVEAAQPDGMRGSFLHVLRGAVSHVRGRDNRPAAEVATALDGTILRDVYLVGTTDRTATFLQVCGWGDRRPDAPRLSAGSCTNEESEQSGKKSFVQSGRVLVMDRALIVCHAEGEACDDVRPGREERGLTAGDLVGVESSLRGLAARLDGVARDGSRERRSMSEEIDGHLNRHHGQILRRLGERKGGSGSMD